MSKRFVFICLILFLSSCTFAAGLWQGYDVNTVVVESKPAPAIEIFDGGITDGNGPTVFLDCGEEETVSNKLSNFMYFVPLISPTFVDSKSSKENSQLAGIISCEKRVRKQSFYVCCEFYMKGQGSHKNTFDSAQMIKRNLEDVEDGEPVKNILEYIKFEGAGYGKIEINGDIDEGIAKVQNVKVHFNSRDDKSPVTIGLYSVKCIDGGYRYESKFNKIVARINVLEFERCEEIPRMGLKIASLGTDESKNGLWSSIKGAIANLFIDPIEINPAGNDAMLDLGLALLDEQRTFAFSKAANLKE